MLTFREACCGTSGSNGFIDDLGVSLGCCSDRKVEATIGCRLPSVLVCAGIGTGGSLGSGLGIVRGVQLGQGHCRRSTTNRAGSRQGACYRSGGILGCLVFIAMCFGLAIATGAGCLVVGSICGSIGIAVGFGGKGCGNGDVCGDIGQCLIPSLVGIMIGCITCLGGGLACIGCRLSPVYKLSRQGLAVTVYKGNGIGRGGKVFQLTYIDIVNSDLAGL